MGFYGLFTQPGKRVQFATENMAICSHMESSANDNTLAILHISGMIILNGHPSQLIFLWIHGFIFMVLMQVETALHLVLR